jgi:tryptophan 2,3-dioxygenase
MATKHLDDIRFGGSEDERPLSSSACPINVSLGAEVGAKANIKSRYSEPCRYWNYIHPEKITSLQTGREGKGLNHHDEHLFIVVHQAFELWFKQILHEVDWVRDTLVALVAQGEVPTTKPLQLRSHENVVEEFTMSTALRLLIHRVRRADTILRIATHGFDAMETMEPMDFLEFRDYLIPASGFQSVQLRQLEILVGLPEEDRLKLNGQVYTQQFQTDKDDLTPYLRTRLAQPSLRGALYKCLAHMNIPDRDGFASRFLDEKRTQYSAKSRDLQVKVDDFVAMQAKLANFNQSASDALYDSVLKSASVLEIETFLSTYGLDFQASARVGTLALKICKAAKDGVQTYSKDAFFADLSAYHEQDKQMAAATIGHLQKSINDANAEFQVVHDFFHAEEIIEPKLAHNNAPDHPSDHYTLGQTRRAVLYLLSHPWTQPRDAQFECSEWSLLLSTVLKFEQAMILWRSRHARMVELMIGRRTGTGGSSGVEYLDKTQLYRIYQDLWRIRALLVPASALK